MRSPWRSTPSRPAAACPPLRCAARSLSSPGRAGLPPIAAARAGGAAGGIARESTEPVRAPQVCRQQGKTSAAVEFGRQVVFDESEGEIVTRFHVLAGDESECHQALRALAHHCAVVGHSPSQITGTVECKGARRGGAAPGGPPPSDPVGRDAGYGPTRRRTAACLAMPLSLAGIKGRIHSLRRDDGSCASARTAWPGWNTTWPEACWPVTYVISPTRRPSARSVSHRFPTPPSMD